MGSSCSKTFKNDSTYQQITYKELLNWTCDKKLDTYHWWPMKEAYDQSVNNLYCDEGGLHKYDILFDKESVKYQKEHYFRSEHSTVSDAGWAGFCDKASILSCLYKYPKSSVRVSVDNKSFIFSPIDIEMLMIVCCDNMIENNMVLFLGERHNDNDENSDINEPYPLQLVHFLSLMCSENEPFVMDIDDDVSVWNYSYDKVIVSQHSVCPLDHNLNQNLTNVKFLNFKIESSAYPKKSLDLWGYSGIIESDDENVYNEGWISHSHPDFLWKKFIKETQWTGLSKINSEIDSSIIYKIYKQSLSNNTRTLEFTK